MYKRQELASLEGKTLKRPVAEVTDANLDDLIMRLRKLGRTWKVVERPAQLGDRLKISFTSTMDGEPVEDGSEEDIMLELGLGHMIPGFEEGLVGVWAGEEQRLDLSFPDEYPTEDLRGKPVTFTVQVSEVAEPLLPEVDAEFAKEFGSPDGDLEALRLDLRRNMERKLKEWIDDEVKRQAMNLLLEANPIDTPEALVLEEIETLKERVRQRLRRTDIEFPDSLHRKQAQKRVALGLILGAVVKANHIETDSQRVREQVEEMALGYEYPQEVIDYYYADEERLAPVESLILESQVVDWVLDQVTVEDEPTTFEALRELDTFERMSAAPPPSHREGEGVAKG